MATIFRNMRVFCYQQLRFVPRFSQSRPERRVLPTPPLGDEVNRKAIITEHVETPSLLKRPKDKAKISYKQETKSLVIQSQKKHEKPKAGKPKTISQNAKKIVQNTIIDQEGNLVYTKMGNCDARINKIMSEIKTKNGKGRKLLLLEGKRLIKEALIAGCEMEYILFSRMKELEYLKAFLPKVGNLFKMPYREMQIWSELTTNPGVMGIFQIPASDFFKPKEALPLTIICDNIREPNNLGAILRTSSAVGCSQVVLTKGCVSLWESKVLRSSCGAHFKLKISKDINWTDLRSLLPQNSNVFIADNDTLTTSSNDSIDSVENLIASIPVLPYFSANFKLSSHLVLIIGGETEGISSESYKLAQEFNGARLHVPLSNGVDSLNTGTALGVIAFEIKRQLMNLQVTEKS